jgi:hypothetical protein
MKQSDIFRMGGLVTMVAGLWSVVNAVLAMGLSGPFAHFTLAGSMSTFTQPRTSEFIAAALFLGLALIATIAGIWARVQNYRNRRSVPRLGL